MEKKNKKIIVPIIIGITLLIALIIGATYAYFQATNNASGTTNLDATTEAIGNVVVTNPTEELYLKLSAYEMHEDQKNNSYYATSTNGNGVVYASERENNVFANYSIEGGTEETTYNCTFKLNITKPQDIRSGDMNLEISLLNGAKINGGSTLTTDLYNTASSYNVEFSAKGNGNGNLITGDIKLNNTTSIQDHLIGKTLSTSISVSNLECEVAEPEESICTLASDSTVEAGLEGAKYNCKVDPNKDEYIFYLLDNNEDGTSDLIMNANINASGEAVIPGVTSDTGELAWQTSGSNVDGPVTAMTYLHNATKSWTNVEPLNYAYNDREVQGITGTDVGYQSFVSINGVATITKGDSAGTQVTIGSESEPLRARMPIYSNDASVTEVSNKTSINVFLYDNLDPNEEYRPYAYWTLSSDDLNKAWRADCYGVLSGNPVEWDDYSGVRPVITVNL